MNGKRTLNVLGDIENITGKIASKAQTSNNKQTSAP